MGKKKIIKKLEQLDTVLLKAISEEYPEGFEDKLISFQSPNGELVMAFPYETEEISYLIKMPKNGAHQDEEDDDSGKASDDLSNFESLDLAENIPDE